MLCRCNIGLYVKSRKVETQPIHLHLRDTKVNLKLRPSVTDWVVAYYRTADFTPQLRCESCNTPCYKRAFPNLPTRTFHHASWSTVYLHPSCEDLNSTFKAIELSLSSRNPCSHSTCNHQTPSQLLDSRHGIKNSILRSRGHWKYNWVLHVD